jgi:transcriptional regulator with XRE-family HTH domain
MQAEAIILKNIRFLRKLKELKSDYMGRELGMSQGEYSKLENGLKKHWTGYLPKIAEIFEVTFQELVYNDTTNNHFQSAVSGWNNDDNSSQNFDKSFYDHLIFEMNEKEKLKSELLLSLSQTQAKLKKKFESIRSRQLVEANLF